MPEDILGYKVEWRFLMNGNSKGMLIIIGGAEDKKGNKDILKHVLESSGGSNSSLTIITTATEKPGEVGNEYRKVFQELNAPNINVLNINSRDEGNLEENASIVENSTGIFFTGGDQLRITSIIGGTLVHAALKKAYENGSTIAGTSSGASVMSSTMIVDGNSNDAARKCTLKMAPGLGLIEEAIIDQHFDQRGRFGRLLTGVAENPHMLGIGIDEDTAIKVLPEGAFEVIGSNAVTVIDGTAIKSSNVSELKPDEILAITNVIIHVLPCGYRFNIKKREVLANQ